MATTTGAIIAVSVAVTTVAVTTLAITKPDIAHKALDLGKQYLDTFSSKQDTKNDSDMGHENKRGRAMNH